MLSKDERKISLFFLSYSELYHYVSLRSYIYAETLQFQGHLLFF